MLASVGLISLMAVPAPGIWGLVIGVACSIAILLSALLLLLDRIAANLALRWARRSTRRSGRRLHAGSGMTRKQGAPAATVVPARPSPAQAGTRLANQRRATGRLEPFRLR